ncbi:MAG TPA: ABC transporter permease, partial [Petrimonas sp.]|nr:ABC transporter permease [Petrimonas sp.]
QVVGIIKDFHTGHLSKTTTPLVISYTERGFHFDYLMARFVPGKQKEALAYLENLYKEINNDAEFTYSLLEDDIAKLYEEDKRISRVYLLFSIIAILVSCMGLFAISVFDIRQRYREIALRKVNGATTNNIMHLFLNKYLMLLAVSFLTAIPISYVVISKHLENFAYKISVSSWIAMFSVISAIIVIFVSLLTLVWQIKTAMRTNPANALKLE